MEHQVFLCYFAEFPEQLTSPGVKNDQEMSICLLESGLKMSKSHANMVIDINELI